MLKLNVVWECKKKKKTSVGRRGTINEGLFVLILGSKQHLDEIIALQPSSVRKQQRLSSQCIFLILPD